MKNIKNNENVKLCYSLKQKVQTKKKYFSEIKSKEICKFFSVWITFENKYVFTSDK